MNKGILFLICVAILAQGCATCPPCVPETTIKEVLVPTYLCPEPPTLPLLELPDWPVLADDATDAERKQWYVDMMITVNVRIDILRERVDVLNVMLGAYREPTQ